MLVIRLQRTGRKNDPAFRIVVADKRQSAKGKFVEVIGHYLPARAEPELVYNEERFLEWVGKGAQPSDTVARLLSKAGVKGLEKFIVRYAKQKPKKEAPPEPEAPSPPAEETASPESDVAKDEAPAEEEKKEEAEESKDTEEPAKDEAPAEEEKKEEAEESTETEEPKKEADKPTEESDEKDDDEKDDTGEK